MAILVSDILNKEEFFGDGPPTWSKSPTAEHAKNDRLRVVKRLNRFDPLFPGAAQLAPRLQQCAPKIPCGSGGCPDCTRAFQRWLVVQLQGIENDPTRELVAASVTRSHWRAQLGDLHTFDVGAIRNEFRIALAATQVPWALFGIDISLNDDTKKGFGIGWQFQFYGFAHVKDQKTFSQSLVGGVPPGKVSRPVRVSQCDGTRRAFSYGFKPTSIRRVAYWGRGKTRTGAARYCWRTRKVSLKPREEVELRLYLDQIGLKKRILLHGLEAVRNRNRIQLIPKQRE
jgi:hypothetical protein